MLGCGRVLSTVNVELAIGDWSWTGGRTLQCAFCFSYPQISCLLQCGKRFVYSRNGMFIGLDVEILDRVADELFLLVMRLNIGLE